MRKIYCNKVKKSLYATAILMVMIAVVVTVTEIGRAHV